MKWLRALMLAPVFVLLAVPSSTVQATLTGVDPVERELRLSGQRAPFVTVFSSRVVVDGQAVTVARFWRVARPGMRAVIKSRSYGPFRVVDVVNVRTGEK